MSPRAGDAPRLVLLGLDGATWDLLAPWLDAGELPVLARLRNEGVWGALRSVYPPGTGPAWSSIATGAGPGKHGVYEFMRRRPGSYLLSPVDSSALRRLTLWDILGAEGETSFLLNVPMTYPPRPVRGLMVTGILTPPRADRTTYPPEFARRIAERVPGYRILPSTVYRPGGAAAYLDDLRETARRKTELLLSLAGHDDWRLLFQVWNETDMGQHALWHVEDERHPRHDAREAREAPHPLLALYRDLDRAVGEVLERLGGRDVVCVLSDHGHGPLLRLLHANNGLLRGGYLAVRGNALSRGKHLAFRSGITPMHAYLAANRLGLGRMKTALRWNERGYRLMRRLFFSFADVDWKRTAAYGVGGGVSGGIFLNVRGREPEGIVEPGAEYERVRDEVAGWFRELADPADGRPIIGRVYRREEIYSGPRLEEAPDLVIVPQDPSLGVFGDFEFSSHRLVEDAPPALSAHHRMDGVLILNGPGVRRGVRVEGARIEDVAPTVLQLAGVAPSEDMDGRVLEEAIESSFLREHPLRRVARPAERGDGGVGGGAFSAEEEEEIRDRFRGMGYIS